jgi:CheY-like chemotaxis protein
MKTILVIDDEFAIADVLISLLTDEGYRVVTAPNGQEGLALLAESRPDLVLLDLMMPLMDGREVLRQMRADPESMHIPVILMSAACSPAVLATLGAEAYLEKPFRLDVLLATLERLLGSGEGG